MNQNQTIKLTTSAGNIEINFHTTADLTTETQHLSISQNDIPTIKKTHVIKYPTEIHPRSMDIWQRYERVRRGNLVIRSGFGFCGCYEKYHPDAPPNPRRPESDTEHASGCVDLMRSFQAYYPELLTPELYCRAEHLLKDHDLGENEYGDRPDDGSQNHSEKDQTELIEFVSAVAHLPAKLRETAISDFICFQDPTFIGHQPEIARLVQLAKVIDKLESVLSGVVYEKSGAPGSLRYKEKHFGTITNQDRRFIQETNGDSSLVASWLAHATYKYHTYYGFPYMLDVVKAAVIDTRGAWFPWFDDFCSRNQIPKNHTTHPLRSS